MFAARCQYCFNVVQLWATFLDCDKRDIYLVILLGQHMIHQRRKKSLNTMSIKFKKSFNVYSEHILEIYFHCRSLNKTFNGVDYQ